MDEIARLAELLAIGRWRIVFAESCTAGLASALLASVPGISEHLCGSWVTYREECKQAWLGVPADLLRVKTAVSAEVTEWMARESLRRTESAHFSAAITGHLGPHAPDDLDGVCFTAIAGRSDGGIHLIDSQHFCLPPSSRSERQHAAARRLLHIAAQALPTCGP